MNTPNSPRTRTAEADAALRWWHAEPGNPEAARYARDTARAAGRGAPKRPDADAARADAARRKAAREAARR